MFRIGYIIGLLAIAFNTNDVLSKESSKLINTINEFCWNFRQNKNLCLDFNDKCLWYNYNNRTFCAPNDIDTQNAFNYSYLILDESKIDELNNDTNTIQKIFGKTNKKNLRHSKVNIVNSFNLKSCGDSNDVAQNVQINIEPVLPQTDYTLFLDAELSKEITSGTSNYAVTLNGIPFSPSTEDLCNEINKSNITCPLKVGHLESQSKGTIPTGVSGKVIIKNQWFNQYNERILCLQFTILLA